MKLFKTILKAIFTAVISLLPVAGIMGIFSAFELRIPFLLFCVLASVPFIVFVLVLVYPNSVKFTTAPNQRDPFMFDENNPNSPEYDRYSPTNPANPSGSFNSISPMYIYRDRH